MKSLINTIKWEVNQPRADEYLHFSTDLQNPRHTCISWIHGYPIVDRPWMNTFPLLQGTAIHEYIHTIMHNREDWIYSSEVPILVEDRNDYSWKGTADAYLQDHDGTTWLIDYKTASGVSLSFMNEPKPEHVLQVSAYYHYGFNMVDKVGILYLPSSPDYKRRWEEPRFYEIEPLSFQHVSDTMTLVEDDITMYFKHSILPEPLIGEYSWKHNKRNKNWEKWYKPHYSSMFCPWRGLEFDPCGCSTQKPKLIEVSEEDPNADVCS